MVMLKNLWKHPFRFVLLFIQLCPEEVDAAVWLSVDLVKLATWKRGQFIEQEQELGLSKPSYDEEIQITLVTFNGG